jgi:hypothetical protein
MQWVERYKRNRWDISRVSGRWAHRFAIFYVIMVAAKKKQACFATDHATVVRKIYQVRHLWFKRAKELMTTGLWQPGHAITRSSADLTARRCLFCRPSCVFYARGNANKLRPCKQSRICPFCYARTAAYIYWNVRQYLNTRRKQVDNEIVTCVAQKEYLAAKGFTPETGMTAGMHSLNVRRLQAVIEKHVQRYERQTKTIQRRTDGAMWSVVVEPKRRGWRVETRQYFVARAGTDLPVVRLPDAKTVYNKSAKIQTFVRSGKILGRFVRYPAGMLTACADLTGIALQASYGLRLRRGTGRFRACSSGLSTAFKQASRKNARTKTQENT